MSNAHDHHSDKIVVNKILNGDIQSFAIVVKNTEKLVTQIVSKMINDEDDQKDVIQDIYLKAYQKLSTFQFKSKLSTWIANIAYNTSINFLQKKKISFIDIENTKEKIIEEQDVQDTQLIQSEFIDILNIEVAKLPALYKTLITLYYLEELPNKEISEITNLPEGTIKSYLFRARKILKDKINRQYKNLEL